MGSDGGFVLGHQRREGSSLSLPRQKTNQQQPPVEVYKGKAEDLTYFDVPYTHAISLINAASVFCFS